MVFFWEGDCVAKDSSILGSTSGALFLALELPHLFLVQPCREGCLILCRNVEVP